MHRIDRILYLHPPQAEFHLPPLGPACLMAFLKTQRPDWSHRFIDLNVDYVHWLIEPQQITDAMRTASEAFDRLRRSETMAPDTLHTMQAYITALHAARDVLTAPRRLAEYLVDPQIVRDRHSYNIPKRALSHMFLLHSLAAGASVPTDQGLAPWPPKTRVKSVIVTVA